MNKIIPILIMFWLITVSPVFGQQKRLPAHTPEFLTQQSQKQMAKGTRITGTVVHVSDGDTFHLKLDNGLVIVVRAQAIDAPEKGQRHGDISCSILTRGLMNQQVTIIFDKMDSYNRYVGRVFRGNIDIEEKMILLGHAWHFTRFNQEKKLAQAQLIAKQNRAGLWADENPMPPWEYRSQDKEYVKKQQNFTNPKTETVAPPRTGEKYWLSSGNTLHNRSCRYYLKSVGRYGSATEGTDCKRCGGSGRRYF